MIMPMPIDFQRDTTLSRHFFILFYFRLIYSSNDDADADDFRLPLILRRHFLIILLLLSSFSCR